MSEIKITPRGDRVLLRLHYREDTKGKLVIPESTKKELPAFGEVLAVGYAVSRQDDAPKVGDEVAVNQYAGHDIESEGEMLRIVHVEDISAILHE